MADCSCACDLHDDPNHCTNQAEPGSDYCGYCTNYC